MTTIASGIYFEKNVNVMINTFIKAINQKLAEEQKAAITKTDFTDQIIKRFLVGNDILAATFEELEEKAETLDELGEVLLQICYQNLPLKTLLNQQTCCQELLIDAVLYEDLAKVSKYIYSERAGSRTTLVNQLFKTWFIKKTQATASTFLASKDTITAMTFDAAALEAGYFILPSYFAEKNK